MNEAPTIRKPTTEKYREYRERSEARHPGKQSARIECRNAIRRGELVRLPCERCGAEPTQAHHDDYSKPLDVRWLCKPCHYSHHKGERRGYHNRPEMDVCKRGHPFTPENTLRRNEPQRRCRTCENARKLRRYHERKSN